MAEQRNEELKQSLLGSKSNRGSEAKIQEKKGSRNSTNVIVSVPDDDGLSDSSSEYADFAM